MRIRHVDPAADAADCAAIYAPYVLDGVASFETEPPTAEQFGERIERYVLRHPWLVAEDDDGRVIGFAYGSQHRERAAYRWAADVSVYVDPSHHRRGVGRSLYVPLFELLDRQGMRTLHAGITLPNDASVGLHESLGFEPVGVYRRVGWKAGQWWDVGWWQRPLGAVTDGDPGPPAEPGAPPRLDG
jgi:L-amino acid N-acyltransferase YncA